MTESISEVSESRSLSSTTSLSSLDTRKVIKVRNLNSSLDRRSVKPTSLNSKSAHTSQNSSEGSFVIENMQQPLNPIQEQSNSSNSLAVVVSDVDSC